MYQQWLVCYLGDTKCNNKCNTRKNASRKGERDFAELSSYTISKMEMLN